MLATGGGGGKGHLKKIFPTYQKHFPDISHFFLNVKKFFQIYQKIFPIYDFFPETKTTTQIQVFKSALWPKNAILMTFFTLEKGTLLPEKGHFANLGGGGGGCPPPGSYASGNYHGYRDSPDIISGTDIVYLSFIPSSLVRNDVIKVQTFFSG